MGWISGTAGPRAGLLLGAGAAIAGGLVARVAFARMPDTHTGELRIAATPAVRARPGKPRVPSADRRSHTAATAVTRRPSPEASPRSRS
jgi:hypothetical protein